MLEFDIAENPLRDEVVLERFRPQPGGCVFRPALGWGRRAFAQRRSDLAANAHWRAVCAYRHGLEFGPQSQSGKSMDA